MKLKQLISIGLASSILALSVPQKANSNPAVLAAPAICAGTAGVGCVVIGVVSVGGIIYYVWNNGKQKQGIAWDGSVLRSEYLEDPEDIQEEWEDYVVAKTDSEASAKCRKQLSDYRGADLIRVERHPSSKNTYVCRFKGGTSR